MKIEITLTEAETRALTTVCVDPQEWAENAVKERARIAMDQIFQSEVQRMIADPEIAEIPADREAIVLAAEVVSLADIANAPANDSTISN